MISAKIIHKLIKAGRDMGARLSAHIQAHGYAPDQPRCDGCVECDPDRHAFHAFEQAVKTAEKAQAAFGERMKLEFARREDSEWTNLDNLPHIWAVRLTGHTKEGRKFILNLTQDADGVVKITEVKGKVRIDAMCGTVEVIGNEY
jgi:hypothetical protein